VQVIKIGNDLTFITLGSEVVVDYSLRFKREFAGEAGVWVAGYSNDYTGYVPSLRVLKEGGYEAAAGWAEECGGSHREKSSRDARSSVKVTRSQA
jgi:hypothetical protein